jgi:hypothetical protein
MKLVDWGKIIDRYGVGRLATRDDASAYPAACRLASVPASILSVFT